METTLEIHNLCKSYGSKIAVQDVSFSIKEGEIFGLLGMNGAGKTTLLRMLATLLKPDSGDALIAGNSIIKNPDAVRSCISYLPDEAGAYRTMTGRKYLKFIAGLYEKDEDAREECLQRGLDIFGLPEAVDKKISSYSRGMVRKLVLSRTVMVKPKLAIMDEPTSGLDVLNSLYIRKTIRRCAEEYGTAFLLSSHHMQEITATASRCGIMKEGRLLVVDTPEGILEQYKANDLEEAFEKAVTAE